MVSGNCMQLAVGFDEKYCDDAKKCYDYLEERSKVIRDCLREIGINVTLVGVVTQARQETDVQPEQELMEKYFQLKTDKPVFNVLGKFTFVEDDKYYINIAINNRRWPNMISKDIGIALDINDKYRLHCKAQAEPFSAEVLLRLFWLSIKSSLEIKSRNC